jgi:segregation and condensation protein B
MADLNKEVEAILFAAGRTVDSKEFMSLLGLRNPGLVKEAIASLTEEYEARESPMMIVQENEGWKLTIREKYLQLVQKINPHTELSKTILETLSVIAWKQPIMQSEVIRIRTNKAYDHIAELERLGFITKDKHGRSFAIKVTEKFLDYFDLPDSKAIKDVFKEFKDIEVAVQKKVDEFAKEEGKPGDNPAGSAVQPSEGSQSAGDSSSSSQIGTINAGLSPKIETFTDELPPIKKPNQESAVEVYDLSPQESKEEEKKEETEQEIRKTGGVKRKASETETPEEKARRIAREILSDELPELKSAESHEVRQLHPKLEEFIAGSIDRLGPKQSKLAQEQTKDEKPVQKKPAKKEEPVVETPNHAETSEESSDESMPAEEYPGQFSN